MRPLVAVGVTVALALAAGRALPQEVEKKIESQQEELQRIKKDIDNHRAQRSKLGKQEKAVLGKLKSIDQEIELSQQYLRQLQSQEGLLSSHIDSLSNEIVFSIEALEHQKEQLSKRLRQLYKRDPNYRWDIILGSKNIDQALARYKFMKVLAEQDAAMVEGVHRRTMKLRTEQASLTESLSEVAVVRATSEDEATNLVSSKQERKAMLSSIRSKKSQHNKAIKELEKAQEEVKDLIGALEKKRLASQLPGGGDFKTLKGRLMWPVEGKVVRKYGKQTHPKYGTVTFNNGIDIAAARGTPIVAVAPGIVEYVDWIDAYGKCIIINHGGGYYTLYAHVSATFVRQDQSVGIGDVIAEVGDTGSLDGYECHFEIRQSKQAMDPLKWLSPSRKGGASR